MTRTREDCDDGAKPNCGRASGRGPTATRHFTETDSGQVVIKNRRVEALAHPPLGTQPPCHWALEIRATDMLMG